MRLRIRHQRSGLGGQALVEFALVFPIFLIAMMSIIVFGLGVFYQQQLASATREAARYAAIHTSTAQCPTVAHLPDPIDTLHPKSYFRCDRPEDGWPKMTGAARAALWALNSGSVSIVACWSGFQDSNGNRDALPQPPNTFVDCTMLGSGGSQVDPQSDPGSVACPITPAQTVDTSSDLSYANGVHYPTRVTVYACFNWKPPMAGQLFLPSQWTMRAVSTEVLQRQS